MWIVARQDDDARVNPPEWRGSYGRTPLLTTSGVTVPNDQPLSGYICGVTSPMRFLSPSKESLPDDRRRQPFPCSSIEVRSGDSNICAGPGVSGGSSRRGALAVGDVCDGRLLPGRSLVRVAGQPIHGCSVGGVVGGQAAGHTTGRRPPSQPQRWYPCPPRCGEPVPDRSPALTDPRLRVRRFRRAPTERPPGAHRHCAPSTRRRPRRPAARAARRTGLVWWPPAGCARTSHGDDPGPARC
jgi:hypothetical protein